MNILPKEGTNDRSTMQEQEERPTFLRESPFTHDQRTSTTEQPTDTGNRTRWSSVGRSREYQSNTKERRSMWSYIAFQTDRLWRRNVPSMTAFHHFLKTFGKVSPSTMEEKGPVTPHSRKTSTLKHSSVIHIPPGRREGWSRRMDSSGGIFQGILTSHN